VGSKGDLGKEDLIMEVKNNTNLGKLIVEMQHEYLKSMKTGL